MLMSAAPQDSSRRPSALRVAGQNVITPKSAKAPPRKPGRSFRARRPLSARSVNVLSTPRSTVGGVLHPHAGKTKKPAIIPAPTPKRGGENGVGGLSGFRRKPSKKTTRSPRALPSIPATQLPFVSAAAWVVADATTGRSLAGSRHFDRRCVASLTKIVTASVVLQYASVCPTLLSETVTVSKVAASTIGTSATLHTGDRLRVMDLLYGLMLPSGNDAAMALAEHLGTKVLSGDGPGVPPFPVPTSAAAGSPRPPRPAPSRRSPRVPSSTPAPTPTPTPTHATSTTAARDAGSAARKWFVGQMNALAANWGTMVTHFQNPHGMDAPNPSDHQSSAADVAKLAANAMKDPIFRKVVSTKMYMASVERVSHLEEAARTLRRASSVQSEAMGVSAARSGSGLRAQQRRGSVASASHLPDDDSGLDSDLGVEDLGGDDPLACTTSRPVVTTLTWTNTNGMLSSRMGVDGVKTGITRTAGPCLCTRLNNPRHRPILVVVLSCSSKEARYRDTFKIARFAKKVLL